MKISNQYLFCKHTFSEQNKPSLADYHQRIFAFLIDMILVSSIGILIYFILNEFGMKLRSIRFQDFQDVLLGESNSNEISAIIIQMLFIFLPIIYFTLTTYFTNGFTIGKKICRIKVKSIYTIKIPFWYCLERSLGYFADGITLGLGFMEVLWKPNRMALHDRIAETIVIKVKKGIR